MILLMQVLFKPFLKALGVYTGTIKSSAMMKKFGGHFSIKGVLTTIRVDIVDSEGKAFKKSKGKQPRFHLDLTHHQPAFLCDTFYAMLQMKDVLDCSNKEMLNLGDYASNQPSKPQKNPKPGKPVQTNSQNKIELAYEEAKPTTTKVNVSVNVYSVTQHINMSLLRLIHQFVNVIENIIDTKAELKGITSIDAFRVHRKMNSNGSSAHSGADDPEFPLVVLSSSEQDLHREEDAQDQPSSSVRLQRPTELPLQNKSPYVTPPTSQPKLVKKTNSQQTPDTISLDSLESSDKLQSSPSKSIKSSAGKNKVYMAKCWRTMFALIDIYSAAPAPITLPQQSMPSKLSIIDEEPAVTPKSCTSRVKENMRPGQKTAEKVETPLAVAGVFYPGQLLSVCRCLFYLRCNKFRFALIQINTTFKSF